MITVRYRKLASGKYSIYLDCYDESTKLRQYEFLKLYVARDYSQTQKIHPDDKVALQTVEKILEERVPYPKSDNPTIQTKRTDTLLSFLESLHQNKEVLYTKQLFKHLKNYLPKGRDIQLCKIDTSWTEQFLSFSTEKHSGQLATTLLTQLKTVLNLALKKGLITDNLLKPLSVLPTPIKEPDYLLPEEIISLEHTPVQFNIQIRDAFLFSLNSGLRWQDVKTLQWKNVSETFNGNSKRYTLTLTHVLSKTGYTIELNPLATSFLDKYSEDFQTNKAEKLVFDKLPNRTNCHIRLRLWGYLAGLNKNLNFSMARNTFLYQSIQRESSVNNVCKELGLQKTRRVKILSEKLKNYDSVTI
jgi:integrase